MKIQLTQLFSDPQLVPMEKCEATLRFDTVQLSECRLYRWRTSHLLDLDFPPFSLVAAWLCVSARTWSLWREQTLSSGRR